MPYPNPFGRDREGTERNIAGYKVATILSFLLNLTFTIMYTANAPANAHGHKHWNHTIYGLRDHDYTAFSPSYVFVSVYWVTLFILQIGYIWHLFSDNAVYVKQAAAVGSHFILFNLLQFAWVHLWTRSHWWFSELMLAINWINLVSLYLRHSDTPRWVHLPAVALPLVWVEFALFWNGAVMVHCSSLACRILANVGIWNFLVFAAFFLLVFKDYQVGFATSFLMAGLGVGQFATKAFALQWIFAFTIMAIVFLGSLLVAVPTIFRSEERTEATAGDRERAPLLQDA
ncbi:hypothetical protein TWF191_002875 [Orbilia oligospora]|uniref:DUF1774-domain-containing protein n=1 Tax=Orbilia oligospora TaxID=2813651 RepID=A0A7C8UAN3_ORBOL|nr:hypothetical protein TWF679_001354 [Orbilia oligospora]KAF3202785.1 hypothetical protein TWF191_002875 [Orbilia oligospora]